MIHFGELTEEDKERFKRILESEELEDADSEYKYEAEAEENCYADAEDYEEQLPVPGYYETKYDFPVCNHKEHITDDNIGYAVGITSDGVPFEAEIYTAGETMSINVIMPSIFDSDEDDTDIEDVDDNGNVLGFRNTFEIKDNGILDIGMVDDGEEDYDEVVKKYVGFLEKAEIISFASNILNGTVEYRVDILGNDLAKISVTLKEGDDFWAYTDLDFRSFETDKDYGKRIISMDEFLKKKNK